jgi:hypothetical protein
MNEFDFSKRYSVEGYGGIAWGACHYEKIFGEDYEWTGIEEENRDRVVCIMVGDDREFTFDIDELTPLDDGDYCPVCGQIGCKAYSLEE